MPTTRLRYYFRKSNLKRCPHCVDHTQGQVMAYGTYIAQYPKAVFRGIDRFCTNCFPGVYDWFVQECDRGLPVYVYVSTGYGTQSDYPDTVYVLYKYARDKFPKTKYKFDEA